MATKTTPKKTTYVHMTHIEIISLKDTSENYQLLSLVGKRIHRETGTEISLGRYGVFSTSPDEKFHLTAKVPYIGHHLDRKNFRKMAKEFVSQLRPYFK